MSDEEDYSYLQDGFDPNTLIMRELRRILTKHDVVFALGGRKSELVDAFMSGIVPRRAALRKEYINALPDGSRIVDAPPSPTRRSRSPARAASPQRQTSRSAPKTSSGRANSAKAAKADPDVPKTGATSRGSTRVATSAAKTSTPEPELLAPQGPAASEITSPRRRKLTKASDKATSELLPPPKTEEVTLNLSPRARRARSRSPARVPTASSVGGVTDSPRKRRIAGTIKEAADKAAEKERKSEVKQDTNLDEKTDPQTPNDSVSSVFSQNNVFQSGGSAGTTPKSRKRRAEAGPEAESSRPSKVPALVIDPETAGNSKSRPGSSGNSASIASKKEPRRGRAGGGRSLSNQTPPALGPPLSAIVNDQTGEIEEIDTSKAQLEQPPSDTLSLQDVEPFDVDIVDQYTNFSEAFDNEMEEEANADFNEDQKQQLVDDISAGFTDYTSQNEADNEIGDSSVIIHRDDQGQTGASEAPATARRGFMPGLSALKSRNIFGRQQGNTPDPARIDTEQSPANRRASVATKALRDSLGRGPEFSETEGAEADVSSVAPSDTEDTPLQRRAREKVQKTGPAPSFDLSNTSTAELDHDESVVYADETAGAGKVLLKALVLLLELSLLAIALRMGYWWRDEKLSLGFCDVDIDPPERTYPWPLDVELEDALMKQYQAGARSALDKVWPDCSPCPRHATCGPAGLIICDDGYIISPNAFSIGGLLPLAPSCVPDLEVQRKLTALAERAAWILHERRAQVECRKSSLPAEMPEDELRDQLYSMKSPMLDDAEFDELWRQVIPLLSDYEGIEVERQVITLRDAQGLDQKLTQQSDSGRGEEDDLDGAFESTQAVFVSHSLAHLSLICRIRYSYFEWFERHKYTIYSVLTATGALVVLVLGVAWYRHQHLLLSSRVASVIDELRKQQQAADSDYSGQTDRYLAVRPLLAKINKRHREAVRDAVEKQANVRVRQIEVYGEITRIWELAD